MKPVQQTLRRVRSDRRPQAGAVSTTWVVLLAIAMLAAVGLWYAAKSEATDWETRANTAKSDLAAAKAELEEARQAHLALSQSVGFRDAAVPTNQTDAVALQALVDGIKTDLGTVLGPDSKPSLEEAIGALRTAYQGNKQALADAESARQRELAARQASEAKTDEIETSYREQLAAVNQLLTDEQARAENQANADLARFDELTASQQTADAAARSAQQALAEFQVAAGRDTATKDAQILALAARREPAQPEAADGTILSVGREGGTAFIDIGGIHGLKRGTRFEVLRPGKAGELIKRGTVEVRDVESNMALVGVVGEVDPYDPILPFDLVRNPHFEKGRVTHFFLLGDFPLTLSKDFVTTRLKELGTEVDEKLTTTTDVLVLGDKSLAEGEFAPELTESEEYKLAERLGMRIIRLPDLAEFLRY
jgi:hypothetical protein